MLKLVLPAAVGVLILLGLTNLVAIGEWTTGWSFPSFCSGIVTALLIVKIPWLSKKLRQKPVDQDHGSKLYGVEHGRLHLQVPPTKWWMNMGYWKEQDNPVNLAEACHALLRKVLSDAGLLLSSPALAQATTSETLVEDLRILDVGFGCGDQTQAISKMGSRTSYIGVTLDQQQFEFAKHRGLEKSSVDNAKSAVQLFQADAARPDLWSTDLHEAIQQRFPPTPRQGASGDDRYWLLALDTLYHFKPSRQPLFSYTHQQLGASIMAFDLLLSDQPLSWTQLVFLRISCSLSSTPFTNFLTRYQYGKLLSSVGYREEDVQIIDVSEHVFTPLAKFLEHQDQQMQVLGLSIGKFRAAKWLFSWWGKTGIVRGCVVIAKR